MTISLFTISNIYYKGFVRFVLCTQWLSRFLSHCTLDALLVNKILLNEPLTKWLLLKKRYSAYHGLLKPNRICRFSETSELSMEEIHRHVHQFVRGARNLWRQGQCLIKEVDDQEHRSCKKSSNVLMCFVQLMVPLYRCIKWGKKNLNIYVSFYNNFHLSVFSFAFVINFRNCKETLGTLRITELTCHTAFMSGI